MFGFRKRRGADEGLGPELRWDIHCHLLPGVDDGVRTLEESLEAIRGLKALGYSASILTPHIYKGLYENSRQGLEPVLATLRGALREASIEYELWMAAEYFADEHLIALAEGERLLTFGPESSPRVLVEFAYAHEPMLWADALSTLVRKGYVPVIAHPERYHFVAADLDTWLSRFGDFPIEYQCNIGSLVGQYGKESRPLAREFLTRGLATYWGTDLHRPGQIPKFIEGGLRQLGPGTLNPGLSLKA